MDQTESSMDSIDQRARNLNGAFLAAAAGAAGLTTALVGLSRAGAPIQQTFDSIEVLSGASADQMARMEDRAAQLGAEMPLTMGEISDSFYELSRAGLEAEESIAAVEGTANLAVAGMLSMERASGITAQTLNAFGYEADVAAGIADDLASVASNTAADVEGLGDALRYVSTQAATAGMHASDLTDAIGVLSSSGLEASMAGTSLNASISSLISPTDDATSALNELGIAHDDLFDDQGNMRSMTEISRMFADEMEHLSAQERSELLNQIFDQRGARAMGALVANVEQLEQTDLESSLAQAAGAMERIENLDDDALAAREAQLGFELDPDASREEMLERFAEEAETQDELEMMLSAGLAIDPGSAETVAREMGAAEGNMSAVADSMDDVVTASDMAEARMDGVAGKWTYITGSMASMAYVAFTGAAPALELLLDLGIGLVDILGEMPWLLEAAGAGLAVATGAAVALTGALGLMIAQLKIQALLSTQAATATYGYAAAQWGLNAATRAAVGAQWLMTASTSQLIARLRAGQVAAAASAASKITLAGAATTAAGGMKAAAVASRGLLMALGPIGWIVLGITAAWAAYRSGLLDWIGIGDEANMVASAIGSTLSWLGGILGGTISATASFVGTLGRLAGIFIRIMALPIALPISILGATIRRTGDAADAFTGTMSTAASVVGSLLRTFALFSPPGLMLWFAQAATQGDTLRERLESLTDAPDNVRQAFLDAIDPLVRFHDWVQNILDIVPGLEDVPIVGTVAGAMDEDTGMLEAGAESVSGTIASYLPQSDAERGPLSNLTERGTALTETLGKGAEQGSGALGQSMTSVAGLMMPTPASPQGPISPPGLGGGATAATAGGGTQTGGGGQPGTGGQQGGSNITVNAEVRFEGGDSDGLSEGRVAEIAERKTSELAEEINAERRKMAEGR